MAVLQQLRQLDDVEMLPKAIDRIPAGTDVLMLVQPQKLPEKTLFAIDQFVLQGGRAIVFVDPYSELEARSERSGGANNSDLEPLFKAWGLSSCCRIPWPATAATRGASWCRGPAMPATRRWITSPGSICTMANLNRDDVITADLRHITMASAGILEPVAGASTKLEPLITTSRNSRSCRWRRSRACPTWPAC